MNSLEQVNVIENHPTLPLIATSGLDNDVKLWSPNDSPVSDLEKFNLVSRQTLPIIRHLNFKMMKDQYGQYLCFVFFYVHNFY